MASKYTQPPTHKGGILKNKVMSRDSPPSGRSPARLSEKKEEEEPECQDQAEQNGQAGSSHRHSDRKQHVVLEDPVTYPPDQTCFRQYKRDHKFKYRHHSLWYRLRRGHSHTGVVQLTLKHPMHPVLEALSIGIRNMTLDPATPGARDSLMPDDFSNVVRREHELQKKRFVFESYSTSVFATIRRAVDIDESRFFDAVASPEVPFKEFISNSRSGQDFFLSNDMRFLVKTNKGRDIKFFLSIIGDYLQHFVSYPHSLIVKYLGCYSIKFPGKKKRYFLVMQNIFYPPERIEDRFDVKGCTAGRYQEPSPPGSHAITVLKDQNFFREFLELGSERTWFMDQIKADANFLRSLNVMDYSLLVGRQQRHDEEIKRRQSFPDLVCRVSKSLKPASPAVIHQINDSRHTSVNTASPHKQLFHADTGDRDGCPEERQSGSITLPGLVDHGERMVTEGMVSPRVRLSTEMGFCFPRSLSSDDGSFEYRRRLLPLTENPLHIIDGPHYRYFFGIVDFLTRWNFLQKSARVWKMVKYGCGEHSTKPPRYYSRRFVRFICDRVT